MLLHLILLSAYAMKPADINQEKPDVFTRLYNRAMEKKNVEQKTCKAPQKIIYKQITKKDTNKHILPCITNYYQNCTTGKDVYERNYNEAQTRQLRKHIEEELIMSEIKKNANKRTLKGQNPIKVSERLYKRKIKNFKNNVIQENKSPKKTVVYSKNDTPKEFLLQNQINQQKNEYKQKINEYEQKIKGFQETIKTLKQKNIDLSVKAANNEGASRQNQALRNKIKSQEENLQAYLIQELHIKSEMNELKKNQQYLLDKKQKQEEDLKTQENKITMLKERIEELLQENLDLNKKI